MQCYRLGDSIYRVSEGAIKSRRKGRLKKEECITLKEPIICDILTLTINLSSGTLLYLEQLTATVGCPYHWNALAITPTVLACFLKGVHTYGLPSRVRLDKGQKIFHWQTT